MTHDLEIWLLAGWLVVLLCNTCITLMIYESLKRYIELLEDDIKQLERDLQE